jgi:hypothetical protein
MKKRRVGEKQKKEGRGKKNAADYKYFKGDRATYTSSLNLI